MLTEECRIVRENEAAGYNPDILGYDNPFNTGMNLELGYDTYDRLIDKGYTAADIKNMEYNR